jgi:hypothetical protein
VSHHSIRFFTVNKKFWLSLAIIVLAVTARLIPGPRTVDDAYITFRYARNILVGNGFVFNPGEHIQGTTTPFYTLLMAAIGCLTGGASSDFPTNAWLVNLVADASVCWMLWRLGTHLKRPAVGYLTALLWAIAPYSVTFSIGGLETSVVVLLLVGCFLAHLENRRVLAALCGIFAILTRPDSVILVLFVIADRIYLAYRKSQPLSLKELVAFFIPGISWAGFATAYFGSPIPHSITAKLLVYRISEFSTLIRFLQHYATPFMESSWGGPVLIGIGLVLYPTLYLAGTLRAVRLNPRFWPFAIYPWIYLFIFALSNALTFRWYLTPPLPAYFLFILCGAWQLISAILSRIKKPSFQPYLPAATLVVIGFLPVISTLLDWQAHPDHGAPTPAPEMAYIQLELKYREAAERINPLLRSGDVLAAGDVGVLGYYTGARILDTVGLNSPQSLTYYPEDPDHYVTNYAIPARLVNLERPDWVVILEVYGRRTLLADNEFMQNYRLIQTIPTDIYGSQGLLIFQRTDKE